MTGGCNTKLRCAALVATPVATRVLNGPRVEQETGLTPEQRRLRTRLAAYAMHARHDPRVTTRAARDAFLARFEREVDPHGELPPRERLRRAEAARKAYFTALALSSSKARRSRRRG
jgi:hypothetical protein